MHYELELEIYKYAYAGRAEHSDRLRLNRAWRIELLFFAEAN